MSKPIVRTYGLAGYEESSGSEIAALHVKKRTYQKEYMDYWNSTSALTDAQEAVTAVIAPIAPYAVPQQEKFGYYGEEDGPTSAPCHSCSLTDIAGAGGQDTRRLSMFSTTLP